MLIPITRRKFEELIPVTATAAQYRYYWGKFSDILQRVLISVASLVVVLLLAYFAGGRFEILFAFLGAATGLYWFWSPVYWATRRNLACRKYKYSGFLRGEVLETFITEELVGKEETVNKQGELVIIENRERRINLAIGDESGFETTVQAPLLREHRSIRPGDAAELIVMSNRGDLSRIGFISDVFLPEYDLWVSNYPYLRRDAFLEVSRDLGRQVVRWQQEERWEEEPRDTRRNPRDRRNREDDAWRSNMRRMRGSPDSD
ncbi:MAG: phosphate ABC transporter permease [Elainella sp.]